MGYKTTFMGEKERLKRNGNLHASLYKALRFTLVSLSSVFCDMEEKRRTDGAVQGGGEKISECGRASPVYRSHLSLDLSSQSTLSPLLSPRRLLSSLALHLLA
jgi:hypothetical protein